MNRPSHNGMGSPNRKSPKTSIRNSTSNSNNMPVATIAINARMASPLHTQARGGHDDIPSFDELNDSARLMFQRSETVDSGFLGEESAKDHHKQEQQQQQHRKSSSHKEESRRRRKSSRRPSEKPKDDGDNNKRRSHRQSQRDGKEQSSSKQPEKDGGGSNKKAQAAKLNKIKQAVATLVSSEAREKGDNGAVKYADLSGLVDNFQKSASDRDMDVSNNNNNTMKDQRKSHSQTDLRQAASRLTRAGSNGVLPIDVIRESMGANKPAEPQQQQQRRKKEHRRNSSENKVLVSSGSVESDSKGSSTGGGGGAAANGGRSRGRESQTKKKINGSEAKSNGTTNHQRRSSKSRSSATTSSSRRSHSVGASQRRKSDRNNNKMNMSYQHLSPNSRRNSVLPANTPRNSNSTNNANATSNISNTLHRQASQTRMQQKSRTSGSYNSLLSPAKPSRTPQQQPRTKLREARADSLPAMNHVPSPRPTKLRDDNKGPTTPSKSRQQSIIKKIKGPTAKDFENSFTSLIAIDRGDMEFANAPVVDESVTVIKAAPVFPANRVRVSRGRRHSLR